MSLGVFLSANFFNLSPYIETIVMSAFTTARDNNGDLVDQYLYSGERHRGFSDHVVCQQWRMDVQQLSGEYADGRTGLQRADRQGRCRPERRLCHRFIRRTQPRQ